MKFPLVATLLTYSLFLSFSLSLLPLAASPDPGGEVHSGEVPMLDFTLPTSQQALMYDEGVEPGHTNEGAEPECANEEGEAEYADEVVNESPFPPYNGYSDRLNCLPGTIIPGTA